MSVLVLCRHREEGNDAQAELLADALASLELAAVYTSPLTRAVWTAEPVARRHALRPAWLDSLREVDGGEVDALPFDAYPQELQAALLETTATARFPARESYAELQPRVDPARLVNGTNPS